MTAKSLNLVTIKMCHHAKCQLYNEREDMVRDKRC